MRFFPEILVLATAFAPMALAVDCLAGQYGECNYNHFNPDGAQTRCAIECTSAPLGVNCHCPSTYPGTDFSFAGLGCITLGKYNGRHKCY